MPEDDTDDFDSQVEFHTKKLINPASLVCAVQSVYGTQVRAKTMEAYGRLRDAHLLVAGALGSALLRTNGKVTRTTPTLTERNALFASLVIGLSACEDAIAEGRYLQAAALLRQEVETLAQLKAVRVGKRKETKAPNIGLIERSIARLYGDLSSAAHVSRDSLVRDVTTYDGPHTGPADSTSLTRFFPDFDEGLARRLFALHLCVVLHASDEMDADLREKHGRGFSEREAEALQLALRLMVNERMVELAEPEDSE
jgi:hypothetical protein